MVYILVYAVILGVLNLNRSGWKNSKYDVDDGCSQYILRCIFWRRLDEGTSMVEHRRDFFVAHCNGCFVCIWCDSFSTFTLPTKKRTPVSMPSVFLGSILIAYSLIEIKNTVDFCMAPETSVNDIHRRVRYMKWVQEKLDVDHITLLDVDMGAHVYYSGWDIVDIAGLVDVPIWDSIRIFIAVLSSSIFLRKENQILHMYTEVGPEQVVLTNNEHLQKTLLKLTDIQLVQSNVILVIILISNYLLNRKKMSSLQKSKINYGSDLTLVYWDLPN